MDAGYCVLMLMLANLLDAWYDTMCCGLEASEFDFVSGRQIG